MVGLARTKLEGLVGRAFPGIDSPAETFNAGVGIHAGDRAFVYLIKSPPSPLGAALAWGTSRGASELHVVADDPDPVWLIQALGLTPVPSIWHAVGPDLVEMTATELHRISPPSEALAMAPTLEAAGCEVLIEHGVIVGEILGLEVARVVTDGQSGAEIRVGVGLYDQEAHALLNVGATVESRLAAVIEEVRQHRRPEASPHPLNRVARERWLRAMALAEPALVGADSAEPLSPLWPRGGIHEAQPCALVGTAGTERVVVVASTGIDLDLVPHAAGHLAQTAADRVRLLLPERDHHDVIRRAAARLAAPADLVSMPDPWTH